MGQYYDLASGTYKTISNDGADFFSEVAMGDVPRYSINAKFGFNPDIDTTSTPEDIWNNGGEYTGMPLHSAAAETVTLVSSSTADTAAGTGARTVTLYGLDENWAEQEETLTLNGTSAVTSTGQWHRLNRMRVRTAGTGAANAGTLTCAHSTTTANVFAVMPAGQNRTTIMGFTVPAGCQGLIKRVKTNISIAGNSRSSAIYSIRIRPEGGVFEAHRYETLTSDSPDSYELVGGIALAAKTDVKTRCESVSDSNMRFSSVVEYVLKKL